MSLLQQIARKSLEQGIPLSYAQGITLEHPLFLLALREIILKIALERLSPVPSKQM